MFTEQCKTRRFDTGNAGDMEEFDAILNNPLCTVLDRQKEKISDKEFDDGKLLSINDRIVWVVTWKEKSLSL